MADSIVSIAIRAKNLAGGAVKSAIDDLKGLGSATRNYKKELELLDKEAADVTRQIDKLIAAGQGKGKQRNDLGERLEQIRAQQRLLREESKEGNTSVKQQSSGLEGLSLAYLKVAAVIGTVISAYQQLSAASAEAAKLQVERVGAVNTAMETLGLTTRQAEQYYQGVEKRIATLGRDLPVSVDQIQQIYRAINDDFTGQLKPRGANPEQLADLSIGASARLAILAQQGNVDLGNAQSNIASFLGGAGVGELRGQTLFQNNPRFFNAIKENLEKHGNENRAEVLSRALEEVVTDQQIQALQGTVTAQLSGFMDKLFDPTIGVFSLSRDLDEKVEGYQSVFEEFGVTLDILIGQNGILDAIGELTGIVNFDPMLVVRDAVKQLNSFLFGVSNFIGNLEGMSPEEIGLVIGEGAADMVNNLMGITLDALRSIDVGAIAQFLVAFLRGLGVALVSFVANINTETFLSLIFSPFAVVLGEKLIEGAEYMGEKLNEMFTGIVEFIQGINPVNAVRSVGGVIAQNTPQPVKDAGNFLGEVTGNIFGAIGKFFTGSSGFIPASNGLFDALSYEGQRKPPGSDFVIANSSEYVLTPKQFDMIASRRGESNNKTVNVGGINISLNIQGNTPQEIAKEAIALIEDSLNNELESMIA